MVALPDGVLDVLQTMPLDASSAIPKIERAAKELYHLLSVKFEGGIQDIKAISDRLRYYNEQHAAFARRLVHFLSTSLADIAAKTVASGSRSILSTATGAVSLPKHDELLVFLTAYHPLILLCKAQCPREHYDICSAYQSALGTILTKDLARLFDSIKTSHLIRRPATDPPSGTRQDAQPQSRISSLCQRRTQKHRLFPQRGTHTGCIRQGLWRVAAVAPRGSAIPR